MCPLTRQLTGTQFSRAGADEKAAYAGRVLLKYKFADPLNLRLSHEAEAHGYPVGYRSLDPC
jgi:hypothetical protein